MSEAMSSLSRYPLLDALRDRRSRRFGLGTAMERGPLAHTSDTAGVRLSEEEDVEVFGESTGAFVVDERAGYRPAGLGRFARSRGRHLHDAPPAAGTLGLEVDGRPVLQPYCPPYFQTMAEAVRAVVDLKFGPSGLFREATRYGAWKRPEAIAAASREPSQAAVDAATAYCTYVYERYGRLPAYPPPFRIVLGFQVGHVDPEFYDRFYRPGALSATQRGHMQTWHPDTGAS